MKIKKKNRSFKVGIKNNIKLNHCANIELSKNEFITFIDADKNEYDFCKKEWGYYISPSLNKRLRKNNYKIGLFKNKDNSKFFFAVNINKIKKLKLYISQEKIRLIKWFS